MRRPLWGLLALVAGTLWLPTAWGAPTALTVDSDIQVLRVARTLNLTADQIAALTPLLQKAQDLTAARQKDLDALWASAKASITAVSEAWTDNQQPDRNAKAAADRAANDYQALEAQYNQDVEALMRQFGQLLTRQQGALVIMPSAAQQRLDNQRRLQGAASLADYMAHEIIVMRTLLAPEYDTLRTAVAMRLAERVLPPDDPGYPDVVNQLLRIEDTVRRMNDVQFAQNEGRVAQVIGDTLNLPPSARSQDNALYYSDLRAFLVNPSTAGLLKLYTPAAGPGGGNQ